MSGSLARKKEEEARRSQKGSWARAQVMAVGMAPVEGAVVRGAAHAGSDTSGGGGARSRALREKRFIAMAQIFLGAAGDRAAPTAGAAGDTSRPYKWV